MEKTVYSAFLHSFECGKEASNNIHYYEKQYVKVHDNHIICIDSAEEEAHGAKFKSIIGVMFKPEYRIELWATKSFEERHYHDFVNLKMKRQIIHFCDGTVLTITKDEFVLK